MADVKAKIERQKEELQATIEKVKLLDREAAEENKNDNK